MGADVGLSSPRKILLVAKVGPQNMAGSAWCNTRALLVLGCALTRVAAYTPRPAASLAQTAPPLRNIEKQTPPADPNTPPVDPNTALQPDQNPLSCIAAKGSSVDTDWCRTQCGATPPNCPNTLCECSDSGGILVYDNDETPTFDDGDDAEAEQEAEQEAAADAATAAADAADTVATAAAKAAAKAADAATTNAAAAVAQTATDAPTPDLAIKPGGDPMSCKAKLAVKERVGDDWCQTQCGSSPPNCPKSMCRCEEGSEEDSEEMPAQQSVAAAATAPDDVVAVAIAATKAAADAANAAVVAAADTSGSALAPQGDPEGCVAVKGAGQGIDDDWCKTTCRQSTNCPKSMCECNDQNGVLRYDPNDPDMPVSANLPHRNSPPCLYPRPALHPAHHDCQHRSTAGRVLVAADKVGCHKAEVPDRRGCQTPHDSRRGSFGRCRRRCGCGRSDDCGRRCRQRGCRRCHRRCHGCL